MIFQDNINPELTIKVNVLKKNLQSTSLKRTILPKYFVRVCKGELEKVNEFLNKVTKGDKNMASPIYHSLVNRSNLIFHHPHLNSGVYLFRIDF